jgi:DNA recombination protein RmuC
MNLANIAPYAFIATIAFAFIIAVISLLTVKKLHLLLKDREIALATAKSAVEHAEMRLNNYEQMQDMHDELVASRSKAMTERDELLKQLDEMRRDRDIALKARERSDFLRTEAERKEQLANHKVAEAQARMLDWEKQKEESVLAARAAIMKAGGEMSSKLLADHKREMEHAKADSEERVRKTTESLMQQFDAIAKTVHSLRDSTLHTREQMEVVMRSLTNPAGVGQMAEIGLENSLKNLGLVKGRDFLIQYHVNVEAGKNLRPDAIIFLPQDTVMVIDCKTSKAIIELASAKDDAARNLAIAALRKTMNEHLRALASRDYRAAVLQSFKEAGKSEQVGHIFNVMYLPSESAIEQVREADPEFDDKLQKHGIILAGPASLAGLFSLAKMNIAAANQAENEKVIIQLVADLMESAVNALSHIDKVGRNIKQAAENYEGFAKSINGRLLPRMRALKDLGVSPTRNKEIPAPLATYDIRRIENTVLIEAEEESENPQLRAS